MNNPAWACACTRRGEAETLEQLADRGACEIGEELTRRLLVPRDGQHDSGLFDWRMSGRGNFEIRAALCQRRGQRERHRDDSGIRIAGVRELRRLRDVLSHDELPLDGV